MRSFGLLSRIFDLGSKRIPREQHAQATGLVLVSILPCWPPSAPAWSSLRDFWFCCCCSWRGCCCRLLLAAAGQACDRQDHFNT